MPRPKRSARKRVLTELFVKKVKPEKRRVLIWDIKQHGLVLVVEPTGAKAWKCIYSFHGRPRWLHIGKVSAIGLSDARRLAAEAMLAVAEGNDPAAEKKAERGAGTFAELAGKYVEEYAKSNNKSWQQGDGLVRRYALPRWGKLQAATIARADVKALIRQIAAPVLANQVLASISAVFGERDSAALKTRTPGPPNPALGDKNRLQRPSADLFSIVDWASRVPSHRVWRHTHWPSRWPDGVSSR
jgi:hypothetical protein